MLASHNLHVRQEKEKSQIPHWRAELCSNSVLVTVKGQCECVNHQTYLFPSCIQNNAIFDSDQTLTICLSSNFNQWTRFPWSFWLSVLAGFSPLCQWQRLQTVLLCSYDSLHACVGAVSIYVVVLYSSVCGSVQTQRGCSGSVVLVVFTGPLSDSQTKRQVESFIHACKAVYRTACLLFN